MHQAPDDSGISSLPLLLINIITISYLIGCAMQGKVCDIKIITHEHFYFKKNRLKNIKDDIG